MGKQALLREAATVVSSPLRNLASAEVSAIPSKQDLIGPHATQCPL